jgi:hypothetical protein
MKKKYYLFGFLLLVFVLACLNMKEPRSSSKVQLQEVRKNVVQPKMMMKKLKSSSKVRKFQDDLPSQERVDQDLEMNPHAPSKTLISFAQRLGPLMEQGLKDERAGVALIKNLTQCALDESVAVSARALCVSDVESLEERYGKVKRTGKELRAEVSPEVQKILKTNDVFMNKY